MSGNPWYRAVQALATSGADLDGALGVVAAECVRVLGPGTTLWVEPAGARDGGPLVHPGFADGRALTPDAALVTEVAAVMAAAPGPAIVGRPRDGGSAVILPLLACAGDMGVLLHLTAACDLAEPPVELGLLASVFAAQAANHGYVAELTAAKGWIEDELNQVAAIQQALLPDRDEGPRGVTVASSFRAYSRAGGDYYDYVELPGAGPLPRWGAMIADAAGHGASAAVEVAMLDAILRTYRGGGDPPASVFSYANRHLFTRRVRGSFITAFAIDYGPGEGELTYASAGHNPPLLLRAAAGTVERLDSPEGIPLGVVRDYQWRNQRVAVAPGDLILMYTDGVVETGNRSGERFGMGRLEAVVGTRPDSPQALITAVERAVDAFRGGVRPQDDQTMLALRIEPHAER